MRRVIIEIITDIKYEQVLYLQSKLKINLQDNNALKLK